MAAAAPQGSLWRAYVNALPQAAVPTFAVLSESQAQRLRFGSWMVREGGANVKQEFTCTAGSVMRKDIHSMFPDLGC